MIYGFKFVDNLLGGIMGIVKRSSRQVWAQEILQVMRVYPKQGPKHVERKDAHGHLLARADAIPLWQLGWVDGEA